MVVAGSAVLIDDDGRHRLNAGDLAVFPKGDANGHHIVNDGDEACVMLAISRPEGSKVTYPDIDLLWSPDAGPTHKDGTPYERRAIAMQIGTVATYVVAVLGLFLIPGPAVLLVLARSAAGGRRVGIATGLGIACGDLVHTAMATVGLSAVLMTSALAFSLVKYAGAAYLIYLGLRALAEPSGDLHLAAARPVLAPLAFRQAVLTELLNPKTALFFLTFLPQFVRPDQGAAVGQLAAFGLIFVALSAGYTAVVALAAAGVGRWLSRHRGIGRWQGRFVGTIFLGLGIRLVMQER